MKDTYFGLIEAIKSAIEAMNGEKLPHCPLWLTPTMESQHQLERMPAVIYAAIAAA